MADTAEIPDDAAREGYEPDDVRVGGVMLTAGASLFVLLFIGAALWAMVRVFASAEAELAATPFGQTPPATPPPLLQSAPKDDLAAFRAREEETLSRWGWIDEKAGIAQIPIDAAMRTLAGRGWPQPDRPAGPVPPRAEPPGTPPPLAGASGPAAAPDRSPRMSPREEGPLQATPRGVGR